MDGVLGWLTGTYEGGDPFFVFDAIDVHGAREILTQVGEEVAIAATLKVAKLAVGRARQTYYEQYWPEALGGFAADADWARTTATLRGTSREWGEFTRRSSEILSEVHPDERIRIATVFMRAYDRYFFENLREGVRRCGQLDLHVPSPLPPTGQPSSALEVHEDREVATLRRYHRRPAWARLFEARGSAVPHPDHLVLNRLRANLNALRALETVAFYLQRFEDADVRVLFTDRSEVHLRARLVGEPGEPRVGSFLRLPVGTVGTNDAFRGFVVGDPREEAPRASAEEQLLTHLEGDFRDLADGEHLTRLSDVRGVQGKLRERVREYARNLEAYSEYVEDESLSPVAARSTRDVVELFAEELDRAPGKRRAFSEWKKYDERLRGIVRAFDEAAQAVSDFEAAPADKELGVPLPASVHERARDALATWGPER